MAFPVTERADADLALQAVRESGAVIVRGDATLDDFVTLTDQLIDSVQHHSVATRERDAVGAAETNVATVNKGVDAIPLHRESSFLPSQPDVVALHCVRPPSEGGQTILCDGVALLAALPEDVRRFLERETLVWRFVMPPERWGSVLGTTSKQEAAQRVPVLMARAPEADYEFRFVGDDLDGTYRAPFVLPTFWGRTPALSTSVLGYYHRQEGPYVAKHLHQVTLGDGTVVPEDILAAISEYAESLTVEIDWRPGDVVLVDNSHVMHGRRAVVDRERRVVVRLGRYVPAVMASRPVA